MKARTLHLFLVILSKYPHLWLKYPIWNPWRVKSRVNLLASSVKPELSSPNSEWGRYCLTLLIHIRPFWKWSSSVETRGEPGTLDSLGCWWRVQARPRLPRFKSQLFHVWRGDLRRALYLPLPLSWFICKSRVVLLVLELSQEFSMCEVLRIGPGIEQCYNRFTYNLHAGVLPIIYMLPFKGNEVI